MSLNYLEFEQPIAELEAKINELKNVNRGGELDLGLEDEISNLKKKSHELTEKIYDNLNAWQVAQIARHPLRPYTKDYILIINKPYGINRMIIHYYLLMV